MCGPLAGLVTVFGRVERTGASAAGDRARWGVPVSAVVAAMIASVVLSAIAFALIAVGGLSTGRGWWGVPMVPVVLLAVAVALTRVEADRDRVAVTA
jgi:hypothetical protein